MAGYHRPLSFSERRGSTFNGEELSLNTAGGVKLQQPRPPRGPPTPSMNTPAADFDQTLTGSPPPPPTPAASPGPSHSQLDWSNAADDEDFFLAKVRQHFQNCTGPQRTRVLADLLNLCTSQQLSFVHQFVSPLLKKDPFTSLPDELCLRVSQHLVCKDMSELRIWLRFGTDAARAPTRFSRLSMTPRFWRGPRRSPGDGEIF